MSSRDVATTRMGSASIVSASRARTASVSVSAQWTSSITRSDRLRARPGGEKAEHRVDGAPPHFLGGEIDRPGLGSRVLGAAAQKECDDLGIDVADIGAARLKVAPDGAGIGFDAGLVERRHRLLQVIEERVQRPRVAARLALKHDDLGLAGEVVAQLRDQARLADARLAVQENELAPPIACALPAAAAEIELVRAADERRRHAPVGGEPVALRPADQRLPEPHRLGENP